MATEDGNPAGIGLHEATLAISELLGPETDNQEETEALDSPEPEDQEPEAEEEYSEEYETEDEGSDSEEEDTDEEETEELTDTTPIKVKVNGEELEVTFAELRNGYSRTADYTRKATELANERKALEADLEAIREERNQYAQLLPALQQQIQQAVVAEPDWDSLYDEDPIEAARLERHWRKSRDEQTQKLTAIQAEQKRLVEEQAREQTRLMQEFVNAERNRLPDVIPEWKSQEVMVKEVNELRDWATTQGLTAQEIDSLTKADHIALIRKAMLYDKGVANVKKAKAPAKKGKVIRPGSSSTQAKPGSVDVKKASQRLARTGRLSDAAILLDKLI